MEFSRSKKLKRFCTNWGKLPTIPNDINIPRLKKRAKPLQKETYIDFKEWHQSIKNSHKPMDNEEFIIQKFNQQ